MSERKPPKVTFESWVERQIRQAQEAGEFDDLPGSGKPLPARGDDPDWWLRGYLDREGLSAEALLPESLQLRRELERLPARVEAAPDERSVRELVAELDARIVAWIRMPTGPAVPIRRVDPEAEVRRWRQAHPAAAGADPAPEVGPAPSDDRPPRRRWWRRRSG